MKRKFLLYIICFLLLCVPLFYGCNETINEHQIFVTSSDIRLGTVKGDGIYKTNQTVKLTAIEKNPTNKFICWVKDNEIISKEPTYEFSASKQTEGKYTAVFYSENSNYMILEKIHLTLSTTETESAYELNELILTLSNKEIYNNKEISLLFSNDYSLEEIEINSNLVYNKNVEIETTITTKINNSVIINNAIFTLSNDNSLQIDLNLNTNINNTSLNLSLFFRPLRFVEE